jgi:hypothetical protein
MGQWIYFSPDPEVGVKQIKIVLKVFAPLICRLYRRNSNYAAAVQTKGH